MFNRTLQPQILPPVLVTTWALLYWELTLQIIATTGFSKLDLPKQSTRFKEPFKSTHRHHGFLHDEKNKHTKGQTNKTNNNKTKHQNRINFRGLHFKRITVLWEKKDVLTWLSCARIRDISFKKRSLFHNCVNLILPVNISHFCILFLWVFLNLCFYNIYY